MGDRSLAEVFFAHDGRVSDKWEHYLGIYQSELSPFAASGRPVRLLEVGVQNGGSLEIWTKYFPIGSTIVGVDINPACASLPLNENVEILIADAGDPASLNNALGEQRFDVIIDDGSHRSDDIIATFHCSFSHLESGGIYIIEDLHTSYWQSHGGGFRQDGSAIEWLKKLVDALNIDHFDDQAVVDQELEKLRTLAGEIRRIAFFDSMAVIEKQAVRKSRPYRQLVTGKQADLWQPFKALASGSTDAVRSVVFSDSASEAMDAALLDRLSAEREDNRTIRATLAHRDVSLADKDARLADMLYQLNLEREDNRSLRASLADKEASLTKLRSWLGKMGRMLSENDAQMGRMVSENDARLEQLDSAFARAQAQADHFGNELSNARTRLQAVYSSTSWRVTTPLRWLGNSYGKLRRRK
jgi:hypothetical protein